MASKALLILLLPVLVTSSQEEKTHVKKQPNIVYILVDDAGYDDVPWQNQDPNQAKLKMPHLKTLAEDGLIMTNTYMEPMCSPSRAALLTGLHPIRTGRQSGVILAEQATGLYTNFSIMPEYLSDLGYRNYHVGKWHLGFCNEDYLPTNRGFHTFDGFYMELKNYTTNFWIGRVGPPEPGYMYVRNEVPNFDVEVEGMYTTDIINQQAVDTIWNHVNDEQHRDSPLFLYLSHQAPHTPMEAKQEDLDLFDESIPENRRAFAAMMYAVDRGIGQLVDALKESGLYDNTIIVYTSDNGGNINYGGSNYPYRGSKASVFEGGVKQTTLLISPDLPQTARGNTYDGLFHVTDWLPTLYAAAGGNPKVAMRHLDGIDMYKRIMKGLPSKRVEMLYNISPTLPIFGWMHCGGAIRVGDYKLITGHPGAAIPLPFRYMDSPEARAELEPGEGSQKWNCTAAFPDPETSFQLYNLRVDPGETNNLAEQKPFLVKFLKALLDRYFDEMIPQNWNTSLDPACSPSNFGGIWTSGWCESIP